MAEPRLDPAHLRILLSNDDGIDAPGLAVLERVALSLSDDVWIVAPEQEQSGASHSLTTRRPLRVREVAPRRYWVDGTPTDCVMLAVKRVMRDRLPDLVLSGINAGSNVGEDLTYSGTVAAAMEATLLGIPAIALSQTYDDREEIPWNIGEESAADIIRRILLMPWPHSTLYNINFPAVAGGSRPEIAITSQGRRAIIDNLHDRVDPRGRPYYWIGPTAEKGQAEPGTDIAAIAEDKISVTPVYLDLTNVPMLTALRAVFG